MRAEIPTAARSGFRVPVYRGCGPSRDSLAAIVEVRRNGSRFVIQNVDYGEKTLVRLLCEYALEDTRREKRPTKCDTP